MIEKAVFSFWSKPYLKDGDARYFGGFNNKKDFLYSWVLSVNCAKKIFPYVELVTDELGLEILKPLNLPFTSIRVELNAIDDINPQLWAAGKIYAYLIQDKPFVHIDYDFYLWDNLDNAGYSDIICQEVENDFVRGLYNNILERYINKSELIDSEICKYLFNFGKNVYALNCGIFGGNNINMINYYSKKSLNLFREMSNHSITDINYLLDFADSLLPEQHYLGMIVKNYGLKIYCVRGSKKMTHLISTSKKNNFSIEKLINRVNSDYPEYLSIITNLI